MSVGRVAIQAFWLPAGFEDVKRGFRFCIAEDIDFIHITEAVGIIAGGNGLSPFCFSIRSTASRLLRLTVRDLVRD